MKSNETLLAAAPAEKEANIASLELFAGAGGLALGLHQSGFSHLGLVEFNQFAVATLCDNSRNLLGIAPELILKQDARTIDYSQYEGRVDLLSGGPPCQPFSTAGNNLGPDDPRNMFPEFARALGEVWPKAFVIENVKGLLRAKFTDYLDYIVLCLEIPDFRVQKGEDWRSHHARLKVFPQKNYPDQRRYAVKYQLIDTADFGVPQRRERVIIWGFRRDLDIEPPRLVPTHSREALLRDQFINCHYWERHGIEAFDHLTKKDKPLLEKLRKDMTLLEFDTLLPWRTVRDVIGDLPPPVNRGQEELFPNHIQHPGARVYPNHIGSFYDYPAKALKAGTHGTPGGENMLRSRNGEVRYFTTREAARIQTFPDKWIFHGAWGSCIRQMGNAVPVEIGRLLGKTMARYLKDVRQPRPLRSRAVEQPIIMIDKAGLYLS